MFWIPRTSKKDKFRPKIQIMINGIIKTTTKDITVDILFFVIAKKPIPIAIIGLTKTLKPRRIPLKIVRFS